MNKTEFNEEQFLSIYPEGIENHYWTLARNKIIKRELDKHGLRDKKILEIGSGKGIVVDFLRKDGFDCYGVDLSPVEVLPGLDKFIVAGTDFAYLDKDLRDSVEVVMLLDVIEHIEDPKLFLSRVGDNFVKADKLIMTVPARKELWSNYDVFNGHHKRYDLKSFTSVSESLGWGVVSMGYLFHLLYLPATILIKFFGKRDTRILAPKGLSIFLHKILANIMFLDYLLIPRSFLGTSLISVCKR